MAQIPQDLNKKQDLLRYAIAGALVARGDLSEKEAQGLTGDPKHIFEERMQEFGFSTQGSSSTIEAEGEAAEGKRGRWAEVAEFFDSDQAGHLNGRSDEAMKYIRDFRRNFDL